MTLLSRDHTKYVKGPQAGRAFKVRVKEPAVQKTRTGKHRVTLNPKGARVRTFTVVPRETVLTGGYYPRRGDVVYVDTKLPKAHQRGIAIHEATEKMLRDKGLPYDSTPKRRVAAHQLANRAEKAAVGKKRFREETKSAFRVIAENAKKHFRGKRR